MPFPPPPHSYVKVLVSNTFECDLYGDRISVEETTFKLGHYSGP